MYDDNDDGQWADSRGWVQGIMC